jgi:hypothetical protein
LTLTNPRYHFPASRRRKYQSTGLKARLSVAVWYVGA